MGEEGTIEESFTLEDVNTAFKSFAEKAPGASRISKMYLTKAPGNIKQTLTTVYNVALALGHFPGRFKHTKVVMIPKKPKVATVDDYRPISRLEVQGKVLERLLNDRVQQYIGENNIFQDEQFGFLRHSKQLQWSTKP